MKIAPVEKTFRVLTDVVSSTLIYTGTAELGSKTSDPAWRIQRTRQVGTVWYDEWANSSDSYTNIFDNRTSYNYG